MKDFTKLEETKHMFEWFTYDPFEAIYDDMAKTLNDRVEGTEILSFQVTSSPEWLTAVKAKEDDVDKSILTKAGVAFEARVEARALDGQMHLLTGVFTWIGFSFDKKLKHLFWFDLGETLETHGKDGELLSRIYAQ
ncbi:hypothetical protein LBY38_002236 [Vibrio vulnificus]|nr:hypothetical protein [Vibrio vulnificus]